MIRVYKDENFAEFEWLVGPIPIEDKVGKEIISRFESNIKSNGVFYTDSNGRELLRRRRNHRDTWDLELLEKVSGNYYPVTAKIAIEDEKVRLAVLTDRAQGGSSLTDGAVELMVRFSLTFTSLSCSKVCCMRIQSNSSSRKTSLCAFG